MSKILSCLSRAVSQARFRHVLAVFAVTFIVSFFQTHYAFASSASSLGDIICNGANNLKPFIQVFNYVAYTAGGFFIVRGLLHARDHAENHQQHPLVKVFASLIGGAALLTLPSIIDMLILSIYGSDMVVSGLNCFPGIASLSTGTIALDQMMHNFVNNISAPAVFLVSVIACAMGTFLVVRSLIHAAKYGTDARSSTLTPIISGFVIGALLFAFGQNLNMMMTSFFGTSTINTFGDFAWSSLASVGGKSGSSGVAIEAVLNFVQIIGLIGFIRGWNVLRNAVEGTGQATLAQGFTHIVGGVLAINIFQFIYIMDKTFGTQVIS